MTASQPSAEPKIDLGEILDEMNDLGRALFDAALERVKSRKLAEVNQALQARIEELTVQRAEVNQALKNGTPPKISAVAEKLKSGELQPGVQRG